MTLKKFKVMLVGHSDSGKTSILTRYIDGSFNEQYCKTVGLDYRTKFVPHGDEIIQLDLWDTTGDPFHRDIVVSWYKNSDAILIVCDLSKRLYTIVLKEVLQSAPSNALIYIVGNKLDVSECPFFEGIGVSSKTGENIDTLFSTVLGDLLNTECDEVEYTRKISSRCCIIS